MERGWAAGPDNDVVGVASIGKKGIDLTGCKFGDLVAECPIGKSRQGYVWLLRCECGHAVYRHAGRIRYQIAQGMHPSCPECTRALHRMKAEDREDTRREKYRYQWAKYKTLYTHRYTDWLCDQVAEKLEENGHRGPDSLPLSQAPSVTPEEHEHKGAKGSRGQLGAYLHPIGDDTRERYWLCFECKKDFHQGHGCVLCLEPVCSVCVENEKHICKTRWSFALDAYGFVDIDKIRVRPGETFTMDEIGLVFEVTRERIRQIECRVLRKIRHPTRSRILREFWCDDDELHINDRRGCLATAWTQQDGAKQWERWDIVESTTGWVHYVAASAVTNVTTACGRILSSPSRSTRVVTCQSCIEARELF